MGGAAYGIPRKTARPASMRPRTRPPVILTSMCTPGLCRRRRWRTTGMLTDAHRLQPLPTSADVGVVGKLTGNRRCRARYKRSAQMSGEPVEPETKDAAVESLTTVDLGPE